MGMAMAMSPSRGRGVGEASKRVVGCMGMGVIGELAVDKIDDLRDKPSRPSGGFQVRTAEWGGGVFRFFDAEDWMDTGLGLASCFGGIGGDGV